MSIYLLVPGEIGGRPFAKRLGNALGSSERLVEGDTQTVIQVFRESAGGALSRFQSWTLLEVARPGPERLAKVSRAIRQQLAEEGAAVLDLGAKRLALAEVQEVAVSMGLTVGLVAHLKPASSQEPSGLGEALLEALREFGGSVSLTELRRRVERPASEVRNHLSALVALGSVVRVEPVRYALPGQERHWIQVKVLELLAGGPLDTGRLCLNLGLTYERIRRHLRTLLKQELIIRIGDGQKSRYHLSPPREVGDSFG